MNSEEKIPSNRRSLRSFAILTAFAVGCVGVLEPGCGGNGAVSPLTNPPEDAGTDSTTTSGEDSSTPTNEDSSTTNEDSSTTNEDSSTTNDSGEDSSTAGDSSTTDSGQDAAPPACTGTETACTTSGSLQGLCVSNQCLPCNSPGDDGNCTTAYGDGGSGTFVCNASGSCVPGNCVTDAQCTAGQICGITTPNQCGGCTTDAQCQSDPTYGPTDICNTTTNLCVPASCTAPNAACVNPADYCCANGGGDSCIPGNCCSNVNCTTATLPICGSQAPNTCGPCTLDAQCPTGDVCDTATGACVLNTTSLCTASGTAGEPGTCTGIGTDECCPTPGTCFTPASGTGVVTCCPGTAGNTYCVAALSNTSATCTTGNTCTTCDPVSTSAPIYYVDPVNGSDGATGSAQGADGGTSASCALKTITRALKLISVAGTTLPTKIVVLGASGGVTTTGETFPLVIPANTTVTTQTGPVTVQVTSANPGFEMRTLNSSITGASGAPLTITTTNGSGTKPVGTYGIEVSDGADAATTSISNLTITGMLNAGIVVEGGSVTIGGGVVSQKNTDGLHLTGNGSATINLPAGSTQTAFDTNSAHGILIDTTGLINLTGSVTAGSATPTGTVVTNGNSAAGVWIAQTPGTSRQNIINGLVSYLNAGGNGMRIVAGSNVQVRNSVFLNNSANGVIISTSGAGATAAANNDIANIDLGVPSNTNGGNTFQAPLSGAHNGQAGICLAIAPGNSSATPPVAAQTLSAVGNQFSAALCTGATTATLTLNKNNCTNSALQCSTGVCDLGLQANGTSGPAGTVVPNSFNVSTCTQ
jgi:Cys-rich repeat protein